MFMFMFIYEFGRRSIATAPDKVHCSMVILMAIEQCICSTKAIEQ